MGNLRTSTAVNSSDSSKSSLKICVSVALGGSMLKVFAVCFCAMSFSSVAKAEVSFNGIEYSSMREAISAINGTSDPGWFTPERSEAIGDALVDIGVSIAADITNFVITSRAPGGEFGKIAAEEVLGDRVEWLTRTTIEYLRNRPDNRSTLEKLMEQAGVSYDDISPEQFYYRGAVGYLEYERELLAYVQQQLSLKAVAEGRSTIPNSWITGQLWKIDNALRDINSLTQALEASPIGSPIVFEDTQEGALSENLGPIQRSGTEHQQEPRGNEATNTHDCYSTFTGFTRKVICDNGFR